MNNNDVVLAILGFADGWTRLQLLQRKKPEIHLQHQTYGSWSLSTELRS